MNVKRLNVVLLDSFDVL